MKPAPFSYHTPSTLDECLRLLDKYGDDAVLLAGGQSLVPTMNFRLTQPAVLIDINPLNELAGIRARCKTARRFLLPNEQTTSWDFCGLSNAARLIGARTFNSSAFILTHALAASVAR